MSTCARRLGQSPEATRAGNRKKSGQKTTHNEHHRLWSIRPDPLRRLANTPRHALIPQTLIGDVQTEEGPPLLLHVDLCLCSLDGSSVPCSIARGEEGGKAYELQPRFHRRTEGGVVMKEGNHIDNTSGGGGGGRGRGGDGAD